VFKFTLRSWNISTVAVGLLDQIILSLGNVIVNNTNFDDISLKPISDLISFIDYVNDLRKRKHNY